MSNDIVIKPRINDLTKNPIIEFTGSSGGKAKVEVTPTGNLEFSHGSSSSSTSFLNPTRHSAGLSGSLTQLVDGTSYLVGGSGINITSGTSGQVTVSANGAVAPSDASYITVGLNPNLSNERSFSPGTGLTGQDNGANSTYVLGINNNVVATITGSTFTGVVRFNSGVSGSLQTLVSGDAYLRAGAGITISTGSSPAGQITIASTITQTNPGSPTTSVQYNNDGTFAGSANFTFNSDKLYLTGTLAQGNGSKANGLFSHAEGNNTFAIGNYSHSEGAEGSIAYGNYSHSEGEAVARGSYSHAEGAGESKGVGSHSEGYLTISSGSYSHAEGRETISFADYSHAEGSGSLSSGVASHAEGFFSLTLHTASHAEGYFTTASAPYSHTEGVFARTSYVYNLIYKTTTGAGSHAEGRETNTSGSFAHAEGYLTDAKSNYSHAEGHLTVTSGEASHSEGYLTFALGDYSHAEGIQTFASGSYSHAEGYLTTGSGGYSHAEGLLSKATGDYSHAEGGATTASGLYAHAEGRENTSSGEASHAEGYLTVASANYSHSEGWLTDAIASYSHAEGRETTASRIGSHAEGYGTVASGTYSHAAGIFTIASGSGQSVVGKYNRRGNADSLFIVGNGTASSNAFRSDIFLVNEDHVMIGSASIGTDTFLYVGQDVGRITATFSGDVMVSGTLDINNHWKTYTPAITATTTSPALPTVNWRYGRYCQVGKILTLIFNLSYRSASGATTGSGAYLIGLPSGFSINTTIATTGTSGNAFLDAISLGTGFLGGDISTASIPVTVIPFDSTRLIIIGQPDGTSANIPAAWGSGGTPIDTMFPMNGQSDFRLSFTAQIPIL